MKNLWVRLGVTLSLSDNELEALIGNNQSTMAEREKIVLKAIAEGRFRLDGETYTPSESVRDLNEEYNTSFEENDYELYW